MVTATRLNELLGNTTEAYSANPSDLDKIYKFHYKIVELTNLIPSHTDTLTPNPEYPQELQPRLRDRAASRSQIDNMAQNLNPRVLLTDTGMLDTGPMIVGSDDVVESGNGRVLALRKAASEDNSRWELYKNTLTANASKYGIPQEEVEKMKQPVLVRERETPVDRAQFAQEANQAAILGMSPFEQALVDSKRLSSNILNTLAVGDEQTIDQALKSKANNPIVNHFLQTVPANERAALADANGQVNQAGLQRLKMAIFAKTYPDESGKRLTRTFSESIDPLIKNVENGMFQSLPDMAKAEAMITSGEREPALEMSQDLADAIDIYARLKQTNLKVPDYLKQSHMFGDELTPFQKQILEHLDNIGTKPRLIREFLRDSAEKIVEAPPKGQEGMLGINPPTKEEMINGIINRQRAEIGKENIPVATATASSERLEKPDIGGNTSTRGLGPEVPKELAGDKQPKSIKQEGRDMATTSNSLEELLRKQAELRDKAQALKKPPVPPDKQLFIQSEVDKEVMPAAKEGMSLTQNYIDEITQKAAAKYDALYGGLTTAEPSNIMTTEAKAKEAESDRSRDLQRQRPDEQGQDLSEGQRPAEVQGIEQKPEARTDTEGQSSTLPPASGGVDQSGDRGGGSMAEGNQLGDLRGPDRLEPSHTPVDQPAIPEKPAAKDIVLDNIDIGFDNGAATRFDANLLAIKTVKQIEDEHRQATPEEQLILAKYSGFGDSAFSEAFPAWEPDERYTKMTPWLRRRKELQAITTQEEFKKIEGSRLNAFYTTPEIIKTMWAGLERLGIDKLPNIRVLEPGAGSGRFLGYEPAELRVKSDRTAVELDSLTGRILKQLYPETATFNMGFERAPIGKDTIDVAISNVPFGAYPVFDASFKGDRKKLTKSIHNYYFAKTLDELRPGGVLAFITTHQTLDAKTAKPVREYLASQADLLGAIRLPNNAFPDTQVCTDIIFMRKRMPSESPGDKSWVDTELQHFKWESRYGDDLEGDLSVSKYFIDHPDMILGKPSGAGTMNPRDLREGEYTVEPLPGDLIQALNTAIVKLPKDVITEAPRQAVLQTIYGNNAGTPMAAREESRIINKDGHVYIKRQGALVPANLTESEESKVKKMLAIRDEARSLVSMEVNDKPDSELTPVQENLRKLYKEYVLANGPLSAPDNASLLENDPDEPFLQALENKSVLTKDKKDLDADDLRMIRMLKGKENVQESDLAKLEMPVFKKRVIHGMEDRPVTDYSDAISLSRNVTGRIDFDFIANKMGKARDEVIDALRERNLIYKNPTGDWEPDDEYLSGDVRTKLQQAIDAASARPKEYSRNVEALKTVQPADIPPGQISARMGATWIPASDINRFVMELLKAESNDRYSWRQSEDEPSAKDQYFFYRPLNGTWVINYRPNAEEAMLKSEYGTDRIDATHIIERILNGQMVEVNDKVTGDDGKEHTVRNVEATIAAQEKGSLIQRKWDEWVWADSDRAQRLAKIYNGTFNNYHPRTYDGNHLVLPGIAESWAKKMHVHQRDAIWRVIQDRTALLAHEVGFGKTAVMVGSGMELKRLGLANKIVYVVPKATHPQFRGQFENLYPFAKILYPSDDDFSEEKRPEFVSRAITGDWDAIILSDTQFRRIPLRPETEAKFVKDEIDAMVEALAGTEDKRTQKQIEAAIKRMTVKYQELSAKAEAVTDKTVYWEDMGVDQMFVDEADNFKNLHFATKMGRIKGLPNSESDRAWDMYEKIRVLQDRDKKAGIVFATGTPIANTIAEMYTMMRYLQEPMLEEKGMQHFDAWAKTFGTTEESIEQTPTGLFRMTQRFAKFQNAPELSNMWQNVTDIRVADEVPEMIAVRPYIVNEAGKRNARTVISVEADTALKSYMKDLAERADNLKNVDPTEDNMLKISSDARKASLDMHLVDANAPENPYSKINACVQKVAQIYKETTKDKGTQLIFLDMGTPKAKDLAANEEDNGDEDQETGEEQRILTDVYGKIKRQLVAAGIPAEQIAFIHEANTDMKKDAMQKKINRGDLRVVLGSTAKLGVGVNVQERAAALHHLDAPWRPRDIEQREGRIVRQGNLVYGPKLDDNGQVLMHANGKVVDPGPGVKIYTYVTEGSFDAYMWQAIEKKSKAIKSIMRRSAPPRAVEDVDSFTMSASEAKAVASGNPDVLKQVTLRNSVTRFEMLRSSWLDQTLRAKEKLKLIPQQINAFTKDKEQLTLDAKKIQDLGDKFTIKIGDVDYSDRMGAGTKIMNLIKDAKAFNQEIAEYRGFKVKAIDGGNGFCALVIRNPESGNEYGAKAVFPFADLNPLGIMSRLDNRINGIRTDLDSTEHQLETLNKGLKSFGEQAEKPFEYAERLAAMQKELDWLEKKLQKKEGEELEAEPDAGVISAEMPEEENEPSYHYGEKNEEQQINPKAEIAAVKAEVAPVEKELEVKPPPANAEAIVEKIAEPVFEEVEKELQEYPHAAKLVPESEKKPDLVETVRAINMKEQDRLSAKGGTGTMNLFPKELASEFPKLYATENVPEADKVVIAKFFHPFSHQSWYAVEYDPKEKRFFGYVDTGDQDSEWGYFSLREMEAVRKSGLHMERDLYFKPQKISEVSGLKDRFGPEGTTPIREKGPGIEAEYTMVPAKEKEPEVSAPKPEEFKAQEFLPNDYQEALKFASSMTQKEWVEAYKKWQADQKWDTVGWRGGREYTLSSAKDVVRLAKKTSPDVSWGIKKTGEDKYLVQGIKPHDSSRDLTDAQLIDLHGCWVAGAIKDGLAVPANVLADYPDLQKKEPEMTASISVQTGLPDVGVEHAQSKMMEEANTAAGQGGEKAALTDIHEVIPENQAPLPPTKEPWQMTKEEAAKVVTFQSSGYDMYAKFPGKERVLNPSNRSKVKALAGARKVEIAKALAEGKPVPPEILAEFPELVQTAPAASVETEHPENMTVAEYVAYRENKPMYRGPVETAFIHKAEVERAIKEGRPVRNDVLADYPDLQPKSPFTTTDEIYPHAEQLKASSIVDQPMLKADLKRLKEIRQAKDMAYDMAINDHGEALQKLEAEEKIILARLDETKRIEDQMPKPKPPLALELENMEKRLTHKMLVTDTAGNKFVVEKIVTGGLGTEEPEYDLKDVVTGNYQHVKLSNMPEFFTLPATDNPKAFIDEMAKYVPPTDILEAIVASDMPNKEEAVNEFWKRYPDPQYPAVHKPESKQAQTGDLVELERGNVGRIRHISGDRATIVDTEGNKSYWSVNDLRVIKKDVPEAVNAEGYPIDGRPEKPETEQIHIDVPMPKPVDKQPWEMTNAQFNRTYPRLRDIPVEQQHHILDVMNAANEEMGVEEPLSFEDFTRDMNDMRFNPETGETTMQPEHRDFIVEAYKNHYPIPEEVKAEYRDTLADIEAKKEADAAKRRAKFRILESGRKVDEPFGVVDETGHLAAGPFRRLSSAKKAIESGAAEYNRLAHEEFIQRSLENDQPYQNALKHSDPQNIAIEKEYALGRAEAKWVTDILVGYVKREEKAFQKAKEAYTDEFTRGLSYEDVKDHPHGWNQGDGINVDQGSYFNGKMQRNDTVIVTLPDQSNYKFKLADVWDALKKEIPADQVKTFTPEKAAWEEASDEFNKETPAAVSELAAAGQILGHLPDNDLIESNGYWSFAGRVDPRLAYVTKDGQEPTPEQIETARNVGPELAGLKHKLWTSKEAALEALRQISPEPKLGVEFADKYYEVKSLKDASDKYRTAIKAANAGVSDIPPEFNHPLVKDENGKVIGYIAYNGNIFPEPYHPGDRPLFEATALSGEDWVKPYREAGLMPESINTVIRKNPKTTVPVQQLAFDMGSSSVSKEEMVPSGNEERVTTTALATVPAESERPPHDIWALLPAARKIPQSPGGITGNAKQTPPLQATKEGKIYRIKGSGYTRDLKRKGRIAKE